MILHIQQTDSWSKNLGVQSFPVIGNRKFFPQIRNANFTRISIAYL